MGAGQLRGSQSLNADECALWRQPDWCHMPSLELIDFAMSLFARELFQLKEIVALAQRLTQYKDRLKKRKLGAAVPKRPEPPKPPALV